MAILEPSSRISLHTTDLTATEISRYARHLSLADIGLNGQLRLKSARVLVVGSGGLGCPALLYLTAVGIGSIGVIDGDQVELSNLQRQVLFCESDLGTHKATAAVSHLHNRNSGIHLQAHPYHLDADNADELIQQYDLTLDCTDDFNARLLINDTCMRQQKPFIYASIDQYSGQCALFGTPNGPCYRCLYETPPRTDTPTCADNGVLGVVPGLVGTVQATIAINWALSLDETCINQLVTINALTLTVDRYQLKRNPHCGHHSEATQPAAKPKAQPIKTISPAELPPLLANNTVFLLDVREPEEYQQRHLNGHLIPLAELSQRLDEIPRDKPIVVHCKSGVRSLNACQLLIAAGFKQVKNLSGGILACGF